MNKEDNLKSIIAFGKKISISNDFKLAKLGEVVDIDNKHRKAISQKNRIKGKYPYCGATKIQDYIDDYAFDGKRLLIGEDGADWGGGKNTTYIMNGKFNVNNHAHVLKEKNVPINFLKYYLNYFDLDNYITGAVIKKLTKQNLLDIDVFYDEKNVHKIVSILDQQQSLIDSYKEKLSLLEEQEAYYQDELLSGRLRIRLTDESINYATQQGWYLNDDLLEGKEKEFEEWIAVDFHSKVEFYKETDFIEINYNEENKNIPKDWNILKIKDIEGIIIQNGYAFKKADMLKNESSYLIKIGNIQSNKIVLKEDTQMVKEIDEKFKLKKGDVVIGLSGANAGKMGIFDLEEDCFLNQRNVFIRMSNNDFLINSFEYNVKKPILKFIKSMGIPNISSNDILNIDIAFPQKKKEAVLINYLTNIFSIQRINIQEKIKVEEEKMDYLMDELLSGRIRVK